MRRRPLRSMTVAGSLWLSALRPLPALAQTAVATPPAAAAPIELTLGAAARLAARQSLGATIAGLRVEGATARAQQSRASLLPSVSAAVADGQRTFNTASFGLSFPGFNADGEVRGPVRTVDVRGRVTANLYAPATLGRYRTAQAAVEGAEADAAAASEAAAANAALAYVRLLRGEAQVQARAADSSLAVELLEIARSQLRAGTGVALDVTRAQAQLAMVRTQSIAARSERDRARVALLRALALPVGSTLVLGDSLGDALGEAPGETLGAESGGAGAARAARPDLRAANTAVETARRALRATRSEARPSLGLFADDGLTSNGYAHLLNTYTLGLQLSIPVWEGGRREGRVAEQDVALREAEAKVRDLEAQVDAELLTARLDLASAQQQVEASRERLRLAEQEVAQARERFRAGVSGNADVIAAQLALDASRSLHVDVQSALISARVALARAEGRVSQLP